ncbi:gamma subclass chorismate mutase AroQ [Streptomyces scopuliridis]|uniref:Gamma subclass chorismate mutase AroQ n=1 Tax=Streptomyces scopuliridis TaxID=452529 RepID=A0ACD4ZES3_9ACTN|nr:gamma subclass chorismate mutase AroQ [Streptomyces scopuliridis]WSB96321.1 gamma subclass chorismate mutase AroQ [Streptomyces scopuliridis]WSC09974.1 gamma subclass chorismate mutase AroQ [Streptomyces scopuliridis]
MRPTPSRPTPSVRRLVASIVTTASVATVLLAGAGTGTARAVPAAAPGPYARLSPIAELSARRLATADLVAAAKWGTDSPADDPVRERQVLDEVAREAGELGAEPAATVRIFRDQIEANKDVQRALHRRWDARPSEAPSVRPDLAEVRAEINRVNDALVRAIARTAQDRGAPYCGGVLLASTVVTGGELRLDAPHMTALHRSLGSVCRP